MQKKHILRKWQYICKKKTNFSTSICKLCMPHRHRGSQGRRIWKESNLVKYLLITCWKWTGQRPKVGDIHGSVLSTTFNCIQPQKCKKMKEFNSKLNNCRFSTTPQKFLRGGRRSEVLLMAEFACFVPRGTWHACAKKWHVPHCR